MKTSKKSTARAAVAFAAAVAAAIVGLTANALRAQQQPQQQPAQQQGGGQDLPEYLRNGRQLTREGKLDEALAIYRQELKTSPDSTEALNAAGVVLDLMGQGVEARKHFARAISVAPTAQAKANAQRQMAMSYAFDNNCQGAARFGQLVFDYHVAQKNFFQQGETANEIARVCLETGDFNVAEKWYQKGYEVGLREPDIKPERVALWKFRQEHAQARLAARRNLKDQAQKHVAAAKAILDANPEMAKAQAVFFPYLEGYVALYGGEHEKALTALQQANTSDPFIQSLIAMTYEKMGQKEKAIEFYRKAGQTTGHNPPAAYARPLARKKLKGMS